MEIKSADSVAEPINGCDVIANMIVGSKVLVPQIDNGQQNKSFGKALVPLIDNGQQNKSFGKAKIPCIRLFISVKTSVNSDVSVSHFNQHMQTNPSSCLQSRRVQINNFSRQSKALESAKTAHQGHKKATPLFFNLSR